MKKLVAVLLIGLFFTGCAGYSERGAAGPLVAPSPCRWTSNGIECDGNRDGTADLLINKSDGTVEINGAVATGVDLDALTNGDDIRISTTTDAHEFCIQAHNGTGWVDILCFVNDSGGSPEVQLQSGAVLSGLGLMSPDGVLPQVLDDSEYSDTADTDYVLTRTEVAGNILTNKGEAGASTYTFPALSTIEGSTGIFNIEAAQNVSICPNGSEQFYLNKTQMAASECIVNEAATIGESITWYCTETACFFKSDDADFEEDTP